MSMTRADYPVIYLRPPHGWSALKLGDLWHYRELVYFMTLRDIKVRYKQAVLGIAWALIQPILTMVIFTVIFGNLGKMPTDNGIPYPLFSLAAIIPWQLFANALQRSTLSLSGNANLLTKVYFPRLIIPVSAVMAALVDFCFSLLVMAGMMVYYRYPPTLEILWLPLLILLALLTALAVGLWLSALNVQYRDVQHMVPFLVQIWMYASPVVYSSSLIPQGIWRYIYGLNPITGVVNGFRWALLGGPAPDTMFLISVLAVFLLLGSGLFYFRRMERNFADLV
jgi:lipopolysaccharide transport system permease protein